MGDDKLRSAVCPLRSLRDPGEADIESWRLLWIWS